MGTWASPHTEEKALALRKLMEKPLQAETATTALYNLVGDDGLFDTLYDWTGDARPAVKDVLRTWISKMSVQNWFVTWSMPAVAIVIDIVGRENLCADPDSLVEWFDKRLSDLGYVESEDLTVRFCQSRPKGEQNRTLTALKAYGRTMGTAAKGARNAMESLEKAFAVANEGANLPHKGDVSKEFLEKLEEARAWIRKAEEVAQSATWPDIEQ